MALSILILGSGLRCRGLVTPSKRTSSQLYGGETMICGGDACSAEYRLDGDNICYRPAQ